MDSQTSEAGSGVNDTGSQSLTRAACTMSSSSVGHILEAEVV